MTHVLAGTGCMQQSRLGPRDYSSAMMWPHVPAFSTALLPQVEAKAPGKQRFLPHACMHVRCLSKSDVTAKETGKWCCRIHVFVHLSMIVRKLCSKVLLYSLAVARGRVCCSLCFHVLAIICYAVVWSLQQSVGPSWLWYSVLENHTIWTTRQLKEHSKPAAELTASATRLGYTHMPGFMSA